MAKGRRITLDLTAAASTEVDRITNETGLTIADVFRHSFTLLRIYREAKQEGKVMRIVDPKNPRTQVQIEIPGYE